MEVTAAIGYSIVSNLAEYTVIRIKNHIGYTFNDKIRVQRLEDLLRLLMVKTERLLHSVDAARRNGEEILSHVDLWLISATSKIEEVGKFMEEAERAKKKCFIGLCPNVKSRYHLGKKADREAISIAELLEQASSFDRVSYPAAPEPFAPAGHLYASQSRNFVLSEIMDALKDDSVMVIGVHGVAGVGKTALVNEVARQAKEGELFDSICMAVVTETHDILAIQSQLADLLGLKLEEKGMAVRARQLCLRLKTEKKVLVVLDDIRQRLDLEDVGIPIGEEHVGCKILLTARHLNVLEGMNAQKNFAVDVLNEEEAWNLFKKMAGDSVERPEFHVIAIEIAKLCTGRPLAIVTVASALRNKGLFAE